MKAFGTRLFIVLFLVPFYFFAQHPESNFTVPSFFKIGEKATIYGAFDAVKDNTILVFENEDNFYEPEIISESPDQISIRIPEAPPGKYTLFIEDAAIDSYMQLPTFLFAIDLSIGKSNLHKREKTQLKIQIRGTEDYQLPIAVSVNNLSPKKIILPQGNAKTYILNNDTNSRTLKLSIPVKAKKTGTFNIEVLVHDNDKMIGWNWDKMLKDQLKYFESLSKDTVPHPNYTKRTIEEWIKQLVKNIPQSEKAPRDYPESTTKTPKHKYIIKTPTGKKSCACTIKDSKSHQVGNTIYTISQDMKNIELAKAFRKKGMEFPVEDKDHFKGQDVPIIPGSAYATGYGDVVGGYANAIANSFGHAHPKGAPVPYNFMTNHIGAKAQAMGKHSLRIYPAKDEKSIVIGVAQVQSFAVSNAIDPLEFTRKFMKEFDRGREDMEYLHDLYGKITDPAEAAFSLIRTPILRAIFGPKADLNLDDVRKHASNTNTHTFATAKVDYIVSVNNHKTYLHEASRASKKAIIVRENLKNPVIKSHSSSAKLGGLHQGKAYASDRDPTYVKADLLGHNFLSCYAEGNGFADSGIGTKTAVFIIGICVNKEGVKKIKAVYDAGMFVLDKNGKSISKTQTAKIIRSFDAYIDTLEKQLENKSPSQTIEFMKKHVEKDIKKIMDDWM